MKTILRCFVKDESGVTAIEYGLVAALISIGIIGAVTLIGTTLSGILRCRWHGACRCWVSQSSRLGFTAQKRRAQFSSFRASSGSFATLAGSAPLASWRSHAAIYLKNSIWRGVNFDRRPEHKIRLQQRSFVGWKAILKNFDIWLFISLFRVFQHFLSCHRRSLGPRGI